MTLTWRGRHMATRHSVKAAGRWTATASGSPATGPATWLDANTTSGRLPGPQAEHASSSHAFHVPLAPQRPLRCGLEEVQEDRSRRSAERTISGPEPRSKQSVQPRPGLSAFHWTKVHRCTNGKLKHFCHSRTCPTT